MGGSWNGSSPDVFPLYPLARVELVLKEIVLVGQIRVGVYVAGVAAEDEHGRIMDDGGVMVTRRWWNSVRDRSPW